VFIDEHMFADMHDLEEYQPQC